MLHELTIRTDHELEEAIEREARSQGVSRDRAALRLLRLGAGLEKTTHGAGVIGDSLDWFIDSWSEEQFQEFEEATKMFEQIDEDLWK